MSHPDNSRFLQSPVIGRLHRARILAAAISVLATAVASAQLPLKTIEECIETGTDLVTLPGVPGGSLSASSCRGCESTRLSFDARTRYFIGKEPVPYARLREAAAKGPLRLYVFYHPESRTLTRLRLVATGTAK